MATLHGRKPKDSYRELLKINSQGGGLSDTLQPIGDGAGEQSPLAISKTSLSIKGVQWPEDNAKAGAFLTVGENESEMAWRELPPQTQYIHSYFPGVIAPIVGTVRWYAGKPIKLLSVFAYISVAPSTMLTIDIKKNGISILNGDYPTITPSQHLTGIIPLDVPMLATDYLTVDVVNGDGGDLTVRIEYQ